MKNFKKAVLCFTILFSFLLSGQENPLVTPQKNHSIIGTERIATEASFSNINGINNGMPNRISMNVTVAKQTQGSSFGEKVINVSLIEGGCIVLFGSSDGFKISTAAKSITILQPSEILLFGEKVNQGLHAAGGALSQGSSLLGGALPGGTIISAAVNSVGNLAGGGAAAASYAKNSKQVYSIENEASFTELSLPDGAYFLVFIIANKATSGLKETLKTQVRLAFEINNGKLAATHDTAKNSVGNIR